MIVQELQKIQERWGWLPEHEMRELSDRIRQPLHRIYEVASFYPLYRLDPPPRVDVKICRDMACHVHGAARLQQSLEAYAKRAAAGQIVVDGVSCLGQCDKPIAVSINDHHYYRGLPEKKLRELIKLAYNKQDLPEQKADRTPPPWKIDVYQGKPRYEVLRRFVSKQLSVDQVLHELEEAGLRGMGGAGFPTHIKWKTVRGEEAPLKYVVCNADESEPGTFKDRELLRRTPYLLIEGITIAALVAGIKRGWIYVRHEYPEEIHALREAIEVANKHHVLGQNILGTQFSFDLDVFVSPGGYVQGEESSLLEAMEDKRGEPRNKPPFPTQQGLFGRPTIINNVETLCWVPSIVTHGGAWYRDAGTNGATGMRLCSISGDLNKPGVYEIPFGMTVRELVMGLCEGIRDGQELKALAPSGPSGGFIPRIIRAEHVPDKFVQEKMGGQPTMDLLDLPLDAGTLGMMEGMLGAAHVVYGDKCDMVAQARNSTEFFRNESCGKCVPCRMGSQKMVDIFDHIMDPHKEFAKTQLPLVHDLSETMGRTSICGLGQVAHNPMAMLMKHFPEELDKYLQEGQAGFFDA